MLGICEFLFILTLGLKARTQGFVSKYKFILYVHTFPDDTLKRTVYIQNKQENKLKKQAIVIVIIKIIIITMNDYDDDGDDGNNNDDDDDDDYDDNVYITTRPIKLLYACSLHK